MEKMLESFKFHNKHVVVNFEYDVKNDIWRRVKPIVPIGTGTGSIPIEDPVGELLNIRWVDWQKAWRGGEQKQLLEDRVIELNPELVEAILDTEYLQEDYNRDEGLVQVRYQISNDYHNREFARDSVKRIIEAYNKLKVY
ncbi:hypothetical protein AVT69_gp126 [Pseudomonas phage PhiPA3]|uniref:Uncharacterized protein 127 n=1 Tax=Pseudomonas phage PhiPA3 TaxID=998086 RepID=F8SK01_BPPA3|nr:hypothetical protein AVT69_gp126 [Pseudomonas phage PhiPA3]AEH03551.1 hypothetical protein [Pseudomonas phage PhiPA3]